MKLGKVQSGSLSSENRRVGNDLQCRILGHTGVPMNQIYRSEAEKVKQYSHVSLNNRDTF